MQKGPFQRVLTLWHIHREKPLTSFETLFLVDISGMLATYSIKEVDKRNKRQIFNFKISIFYDFECSKN